MVLGVFLGFTGDPIERHNIPNYPPFSPALALLFVIGVGLALLSLRKRAQRGWTLLLWWGVLIIPGILSMASNPHFPRLFGALPAALLLAAWPVATVAEYLRGRDRRWQIIVALLLVLLLAGEGTRTVRAYFVTWRQMDHFADFQGDIWSLGEQIKAAGDIGLVPLSSDDGDILDYGFADLPLHHLRIDEAAVESWLEERGGGRRAAPTCSRPCGWKAPTSLLTPNISFPST